MKLVRLYPRDPERGWFIQTYVDPQLALKFVATRGWYQVEDYVAEELSKVRQKDYDPRSGLAFLIASDKDEARRLEKTLISKPTKEEELIGTIDSPVPAKRIVRPGSRTRKKTPSSKRSSKAVSE